MHRIKKILRRLEPLVWISEDATRITGRVQYDSLSNELIGFVLPLSSNGMPVRGIYKARSAREIEEHFKGNSTVAHQVINFFLVFFIHFFNRDLYSFLGICNYGTTTKK